MKRLTWLVIAAALALTAHAAPLFTLTSANISATPGSTIGWGFTNSSDVHYLTVMNVALLPLPSIGTFNDMLSVRPVFEVGPAPSPALSVTEGFDIGLGAGIASFEIDAGAPIGSVAFATLYVVYNLYTVSPNFNPLFDPFDPLHTYAEGLTFEIPVTVTVLDPAAVPEPATFGTVLVSLVTAWGYARYRGRNGTV